MAIYKGDKKVDSSAVEMPISTSITSSSTNSEVAGAKAVYDNSLDVYSTTEQIVGTWIDSKPIYRRTFQIDGAGSSVSNNILASLDIDKFLKGEWISWGSGDFIVKNVGYNSSTKLLVNKPSEWSVAFTVEYTKTTD